MEQLQPLRKRGKESVHAIIATCRDIEAGVASAVGSGLADGISLEFKQKLQLLAAVSDGVGAGQQQPVEAVGIGRIPLDRLDFKQGRGRGIKSQQPSAL